MKSFQRILNIVHGYKTTHIMYIIHTLTKNSLHAGFFNPLKMDAKIPSNVCWFNIRQYPFCA